MPFEVFKKSSAPVSTVPTVTIQKKGLISLNRAAYGLLESPEAVELLWDPDRRIIGIRPADPAGENSYPARPQSKESERGPVLVAGQLFTKFIGLDTSIAKRWRPRLEEGILCIDLNEEGQMVVSNRSRNSQPTAGPNGSQAGF